MAAPLRIFIGFDPRQAVTYNVLQFSILRRASRPVSITPLVLETLPVRKSGLTPFTFTRFLVPELCGHDGLALFLDADMLVLGDIAEVFDAYDGKSAVMFVDAVPFERASMMLFNCAHEDNRKLTPEFIQSAKNLHTIGWTENVGHLPKEWNFCVLYEEPTVTPKLVHYTAGVPVFPETQGCPFTKEWMREAEAMNHTLPWFLLMGPSVHAQKVFEFMRHKYETAGQAE